MLVRGTRCDGVGDRAARARCGSSRPCLARLTFQPENAREASRPRWRGVRGRRIGKPWTVNSRLTGDRRSPTNAAHRQLHRRQRVFPRDGSGSDEPQWADAALTNAATTTTRLRSLRTRRAAAQCSIVLRTMSASQSQQAYALARERYASLGVDTDGAMKQLARIPISLHCWQGDDVGGFEKLGTGLGGGLAATGNYPGKARTPDELRSDAAKALSLLPEIGRAPP